MAAMSFTFVDVLVVAVLLISAIFAAYRGFVRESLAIIAWAAAAFAALFFGPVLVRAFHGLMSGWFAILAAYGGIFLVVVIPLSFMSYRFAESVRRSPVNAVDRALGVVFGAVRGLAVIALCYIVFGLFVPPKDQPRWMTGAFFLPLIQSSSETVLAIIPDQTIGKKAAAVAAEPVKKHEKTKAERKLARDAVHEHGRAHEPVHRHAAKKPKKSYGHKDRQALDKLIEANGGEKQP